MFDTINLREDLRTKLENGYKIRPFPEAVSRLMAATKDPDANAIKITEIIETDSGLASRILSMANSPIFGLSREVQSVRQAVVVLGIRPIKDMAVNFAGYLLINESGECRQHRKALWEHSLACAITAKELSQFHPEISSDEAFLAGIFHDVGKTIFLDLVPDEYSTLMYSKYGSALTAHEVQQFGITHELAAEKMMRVWGLPDEISIPSTYHHRPMSTEKQRVLAETVGNADLISMALGIGATVDAHNVVGGDELLAAYNLSDEDVEELRSKIDSEFEQLCSVY